jgi:hypothetical protein
MPRLTVQGSSTGYNNEFTFDWEDVLRWANLPSAQDEGDDNWTVIVPIGKMAKGDYISAILFDTLVSGDQPATAGVGNAADSGSDLVVIELNTGDRAVNNGSAFRVVEEEEVILQDPYGWFAEDDPVTISLVLAGQLRDYAEGSWRIRWLQHYSGR